MNEPLRILLIEDSDDDALLIERALRKGPHPLQLQRIQTLQDLGSALDGAEWDLVISDYSLAGFTGLQALERVNALGKDLPFILMSGAIGEELAAETMRRGAKDFIRKERLERLLPTLDRELADREVRRQHKVAAEALRESERRFSEISNLMGELIWEVDAEGRYTYLSSACRSLLGYQESELIGRMHFYDLSPPEDREALRQGAFEIFRQQGRFTDFPNRMVARDGRVLEVLTNGVPIVDPQGLLLGYRGADRDITEKKRAEEARHTLEAQLHQSQKMESLGLLAGGVAHDLNNVLAAILSLSSTQRVGLQDGSALAEALDTITRACTRGREVVRGLLSFARKGLDSVQRVDLNAVVRDLVQLLDHTTLSRVEISLDLAKDLPPIQGDPSALTHALMNLCVNAVDAMPNGGRLKISTHETPTGADLCVQDDGEGMSPEVLKRAMEPFYTTKPPGQGTGLGLSQVFGTVKAHGGNLVLESSPGMGTQATLTFPKAPNPVNGPNASGEPAAPRRPVKGLRILLVDDDELIRESVAPMLEALGHCVETAAGGLEALGFLEKAPSLDLVILDMNMPGLSGAQTLPRLRNLCPDLMVVIASGYNDRHSEELIRNFPRVTLLQKPFSLGELERKLASLPI